MVISTISGLSSVNYTVSTPVYEGPLDLLLQLIERAELDITKLALAQVTDQYLTYLKSYEERSPEDVSAFLVIAARLIQVKSMVLLPGTVSLEPDEEDPGEALAEQLRIYKRYRQIADFLNQRIEDGLRSYVRLATPVQGLNWVDLSDVSLDQLVEAGFRVFCPTEYHAALETVITAPRVTIREKINLIGQFLKERRRASFRTLLDCARSKIEIVVTFLAVLELSKRYLIQATQEFLFSDIILEPLIELDDTANLELEFGD